MRRGITNSIFALITRRQNVTIKVRQPIAYDNWTDCVWRLVPPSVAEAITGRAPWRRGNISRDDRYVPWAEYTLQWEMSTQPSAVLWIEQRRFPPFLLLLLPPSLSFALFSSLSPPPLSFSFSAFRQTMMNRPNFANGRSRKLGKS